MGLFECTGADRRGWYRGGRYGRSYYSPSFGGGYRPYYGGGFGYCPVYYASPYRSNFGFGYGYPGYGRGGLLSFGLSFIR